jgi:N4-gp56 family major capsid protein
MATVVTTTTQIDPQQQYVLNRSLLVRNTPYNIHDQVTSKVPFASRQGNYIKFRRHNSWAVSTTPLLEGITRAAIKGTKTDYTAALYQYGNHTFLSDFMVEVNQEAVIAEQSDIARENMQETMDIIRRDAMLGGTSVYYAGNVAGRTSIVTAMSTADLTAIDRALLGNKAQYWNAITSGSQNYNSAAIRPSWLCIVHPDAKKNIEGLSGFKSAEQYASQTKLLEGEVGVWNNFRFLITTNGKIYTDGGGSAVAASLKYTTANTACDVYAMLIFGKNAVHESEMSALNTGLIVKGFGSAGTEDPYNQRMSIAWKTNLAMAITNDSNMYRYEFGVSA